MSGDQNWKVNMKALARISLGISKPFDVGPIWTMRLTDARPATARCRVLH